MGFDRNLDDAISKFKELLAHAKNKFNEQQSEEAKELSSNVEKYCEWFESFSRLAEARGHEYSVDKYHDELKFQTEFLQSAFELHEAYKDPKNNPKNNPNLEEVLAILQDEKAGRLVDNFVPTVEKMLSQAFAVMPSAKHKYNDDDEAEDYYFDRFEKKAADQAYKLVTKSIRDVTAYIKDETKSSPGIIQPLLDDAKQISGNHNLSSFYHHNPKFTAFMGYLCIVAAAVMVVGVMALFATAVVLSHGALAAAFTGPKGGAIILGAGVVGLALGAFGDQLIKISEQHSNPKNYRNVSERTSRLSHFGDSLKKLIKSKETQTTFKKAQDALDKASSSLRDKDTRTTNLKSIRS